MYRSIAVIHSLNGQTAKVLVLSHRDNNHIIVQYQGETYTAIFNPLRGIYYVDDLYGRIYQQ